MARSDRLFKKSYNEALDRILFGQKFSSISDISRCIDVSRNTARRILYALEDQNILFGEGEIWSVRRKPDKRDYFPESDTLSVEESLEVGFMDWIFKNEIRPGARFSEGVIARTLDVSPAAVRKFLIRLSRVGFIRDEPQRRWILEGFTKDYVEEVYEVRVLFEMRCVEKLIALPDDDPFWPAITRILLEHREFVKNNADTYLEFPKLDAYFHRLLNKYSGNRFIESFQDIISLIFHYHYRWNRTDERERNIVAAKEHIRVIEAIVSRQPAEAQAALKTHLETAKLTMMRAIEWEEPAPGRTRK